MNAAQLLANRFREVVLNGTWITGTNFKDQLDKVDFSTATTQVKNLNTIAKLTFHIHYYIAGVLNVFDGGQLEIKDKHSFDLPPIESEESWERLRNSLYNDAERFAKLLEQMPASKMDEVFVDEKYGTYHRNMDGIIEHSYYHLGQVVLIRKLIEQEV